MAFITPQYPRKVFDGYTTHNPWRTSRDIVTIPDSHDYDQLAAEIIATQIKVNDLGSTAGATGPQGPPGSNATNYARIGQFTCPGLTGDFSITGLGFKPKIVKFYVSKGPGLQTHFCCCQGMMDEQGNQNSMTWAGVWSNIFKGDSRIDKCMYTINSSGNSQVTAGFISMDDDGFTVNFEVVNTLFIIRWEAIG
jgi:hypothetical protein